MMNIQLFYYKYHNEKRVEAIAPSHIHYFDLTICLKGEISYCVDGKNVVVPEESAILMPPGTKRQRFVSEHATEYASFNFLTEEKLDVPLLLEDCVRNDVKLMIFSCNELKNDPTGYSEEELESIAVSILCSLKRQAKNGKTSAVTLGIERFIRENYAEKLSLKTICGGLSYSPTYCDALFKKEKGESIVNYLIDYRLNKAKELLLENRLPLLEISDVTGFSDYNYFSRQFKKRTGVTPLKYRLEFNR